MSDWESDKSADWGDKPVEPEKESKPFVTMYFTQCCILFQEVFFVFFTENNK